ncbi:serine acetyltransferase [bacterium]|nr:serine acetyltransferase [bacterium]
MSDTQSLNKHIQFILDSYDTLGGVSYTDGDHLPSRSSVQSILKLLKEILFPGYFESTPINSSNLQYIIGQKVVAVAELLCVEISKILVWSAKESGRSLGIMDAKLTAKHTTDKFLAYIPELRSLLKQDVLATYEGDPAAKSEAEIILSYPGFLATTIYRIAHFLYTMDIPLMPRIMAEIVHSETGIDIHPGATIGSSFCIDHGTGIVIGETSVIGQNVKLYQGVTLGALSVPKSKSSIKRHPTLGDNIVVYAETTILGGDTTVGSNSVIGGNVWITQSIPENSKIYLSSDYQQLIKSGKIGGSRDHS